MGDVFTVKGPTNWWRVAAMAAVPLCIYTTYSYVEAQATLNHLREELQLPHIEPSHTKPATNVPPVKP